MKDTTGKPSLRPARILYHPYEDEGQWKFCRVLEKIVPEGMTGFDVMLPGEEREFDAIKWEYEEHMSWPRRHDLTSLLPDFMGMARRGVAGVKGYLCSNPRNRPNHFRAPKPRVASNIQSQPRHEPSRRIPSGSHQDPESRPQDRPTHSNTQETTAASHAAAPIAERGGGPAARSDLPSSGQPSSSQHPQPAPASNGPPNPQAPAVPASAVPSTAPAHPQPPPASLRPESGSLKVRGHPLITTWHRSRASHPLTHPPAVPESVRGDLYVHTYMAAVQLWVFRGEDGWVEACEGHRHPELWAHRLHVRADGVPTWVTRQTVAAYKGRGRKRLLGGA